MRLSSTAWQATWSTTCGRSLRQRSLACGQRGWKVQPVGGSSGFGTSPATGVRGRPVMLEVGDRVEQHARVGVPRRARTAALVGASSTRRPRYITPTRSATWRHHREVVRDEEIGEAAAALQVLHQVEDLRLHRDVERRGRLVADQELGLAPRARARSRCAGAGRRRTRADTSRRRRGDRPTWRSSSPTRSRVRACRCRMPCARIGSATMSRTRQRGLRLAYGSWKIICMRRRSAPARSNAACASCRRTHAPRSAYRPTSRRATVRLAAARLADQRERLALGDRRSSTPSTACRQRRGSRSSTRFSQGARDVEVAR